MVISAKRIKMLNESCGGHGIGRIHWDFGGEFEGYVRVEVSAFIAELKV